MFSVGCPVFKIFAIAYVLEDMKSIRSKVLNDTVVDEQKARNPVQ